MAMETGRKNSFPSHEKQGGLEGYAAVAAAGTGHHRSGREEETSVSPGPARHGGEDRCASAEGGR